MKPLCLSLGRLCFALVGCQSPSLGAGIKITGFVTLIIDEGGTELDFQVAAKGLNGWLLSPHKGRYQRLRKATKAEAFEALEGLR